MDILSMIILSSLIRVTGMGAGPNPAVKEREAGYTLDRLPIYRWANTKTQTAICTHINYFNLTPLTASHGTVARTCKAPSSWWIRTCKNVE